MRARNIVLSVLGAGVLAVGTFIAWLMWPLPSAQFDWQYYADEMAAEGECLAFEEFLLSLSATDPVGVAAYLDEGSLLIRCPIEGEGSEGKAAYRAAEMTREIQEIVDFMSRYPGYMSDPVRATEIAFEFWAEGRRLRDGWIGSIAWPDLLVGFRCVRPIEFGPSHSWYAIRTDSDFPVSRPEPIPAWEARYSWCRRMALQAATDLTELSENLDGDQAEAFSERADRYRRLAARSTPFR